MAYTYDPIFAQDPNNPNTIAKDAAITLYDPADATKAPITITDPTGSPLPNPITVDSFGMGPAFQHATLDRVAWTGAGFTNYFTSYEGMKNTTVEAKAAAQAAESSALLASAAAVQAANDAAAAAVAPTDAKVDEAIARADIPAQVGNVVPGLVNDQVVSQIPPLVAAAIASDATPATAAAAAVTTALSDADVMKGTDTRVLAVTDHPDYAYVMLDSAGRASEFAIGKDGRLAPFALQAIAVRAANISDASTKSDTAKVATWGESTTEGGSAGVTYPAALAALLPSKTITNRGVSGQTSGSIAVRQGGNILTLAAFTIPTSGGVTVTVTASISPANIQNSPTFSGTIAGIPGSLNKNGSGVWTFTRTSAGTATAVAANTAFIADQAAGNRGDVSIFWAGINDATFADPNHATGMVAAFSSMIAHFDRQIARFLVVSTTTTSSWTSGTSGYVRVAAINAALAAKWPSNYVDLRRHIIDNGLALAGITPTAPDLAAVAADTIPPSLLADGVHPNETCRVLVIAPFIRDELAKRGWV